MPMYTYQCNRCDLEQEKITFIANRDEQYCPQCGARLQRKLDRPGLVWAPTAGGYR